MSSAGADEAVPSLKFIERSRLEQGKIMLYRAHLDVHAQGAADSLSVSLNIMQTTGAQGWLDQYRFDLERRRDRRDRFAGTERGVPESCGRAGQR
jgi:hypothetical protein